jgi:hypothetical protein
MTTTETECHSPVLGVIFENSLGRRVCLPHQHPQALGFLAEIGLTLVPDQEHPEVGQLFAVAADWQSVPTGAGVLLTRKGVTRFRVFPDGKPGAKADEKMDYICRYSITYSLRPNNPACAMVHDNESGAVLFESSVPWDERVDGAKDAAQNEARARARAWLKWEFPEADNAFSYWTKHSRSARLI